MEVEVEDGVDGKDMIRLRDMGETRGWWRL
jgi:hypothetical protein